MKKVHSALNLLFYLNQDLNYFGLDENSIELQIKSRTDL